tara:strand:+ start:672 stop:875 length:204 start_codon:yes stop_codon:yes gene_type:complete
MASVKIVTNTPGAAPKAQPFADIKDQGRIPYKQMEDVATPSTAKASVTTGKKRGMGAALRGSRFTSA